MDSRKVKPFTTHGFDYGYDICSQGILASLPSLDHQNTWTWKLSPALPPRITENHKIVPKVGPRRLPKSTLKSIKTAIWASVGPLGAPLDPRIIKMVPQVLKKEPRGHRNQRFSKKKRSISAVNLSSTLPLTVCQSAISF